jgi:hypothetical protein
MSGEMPGVALLRPVAAHAQTVRDRLLAANSTGGDALKSLRAIERAIDASFSKSKYYEVAEPLRADWAAATRGMQPTEEHRWAACLLADFIAQSPERLRDFPSPESVIPHTAHELSRILADIETQPEEARNLTSDPFLKDLSLSRLDSFPCVAQIVEKRSGIPRRIAAREFLRAFRQLLRLGVSSRFRYAPFFEIHTHTPMLGGFTPEGWDQCYLLVADLLVQYPDYHALVGGSWFYDPLLDGISPRLAYLRKTPVDGGAFLIRAGSTNSDIVNATATSETRRKLYEEGKYHPTGWLMIWPREALLAWARQRRRKAG